MRMSNRMSGLIWIQTVCISYQQMTLVSKGLNIFPVEPGHILFDEPEKMGKLVC